MGFRNLLGIIFSFHSWQATRERKKPVPSPQPKGIKTLQYIHTDKLGEGEHKQGQELS